MTGCQYSEVSHVGGVENKEHYRFGHLGGDMRFAHAVPRKRGDKDLYQL